MDLASWSDPAITLQSDHRPDGVAVAWGAHQPDAQAGFGAGVSVEPGLSAVLRDHDVGAPVVIEITQRQPALLAIHAQTALLAGHRRETPVTLSQQEQAASGILSRRVGLGAEKVLGQHEIFAAVAIQVGRAHPESRSHLRLDRERPGEESLALVEEDEGAQLSDGHAPG